MCLHHHVREYSSDVIMKSEFIFFVKLHVTFYILIVDDLKLLVNFVWVDSFREFGGTFPILNCW